MAFSKHYQPPIKPLLCGPATSRCQWETLTLRSQMQGFTSKIFFFYLPDTNQNQLTWSVPCLIVCAAKEEFKSPLHTEDKSVAALLPRTQKTKMLAIQKLSCSFFRKATGSSVSLFISAKKTHQVYWCRSFACGKQFYIWETLLNFRFSFWHNDFL